jgi:ribosomal protein L37AE/L43A
MTKKPSESEEEYFARQDAEARRKLAIERRREMEAAESKALKDLHYMHCPNCGHKLENVTFKGLQIGKCFHCDGTFLDSGELEALAGKEPGFLHSVVSLFKGDK